ncbi:MAG: hypothetical protein A2W93_09885 [Bacteroidetes bacterium GWF2_43_63]|nr:MAG: hypothetical protein A2W94_00025 [Bacteroidetes bacterium GWE2_42_42]OFY56163.1 MAG: hypothetical protein A2W93_09885 [Bacteroidetes bacterium GWF2_43_63]HBG69739.1 hypothetical protein [Bacteroidales bacterium]HCB61115.1 hypothetical protein [Bacteroidales bacterium]HCY24088.1 hypothetical protein [Bacteroidales bacterium]
MEISPQTFMPFRVEDTTSALYLHGRTMDEAPVLFSENPDSTIIRQTTASDYSSSGRFFTNTDIGNPAPETKKNNPDDFLFITALVVPLLISLWLVRVDFQRIQGAFRAAFNNRFASIFMRNFSIGNHLSTYIIVLNTALCLAVGTWLWLFHKEIIPAENGFETLLLLLAGFSGYYILRYLIIYLAKVVYMTSEITEQYLYRDYFIMAMLATVLPLMLFAVAFSPVAQIFWYITLGFVALLQAYRILLSLYTGILETTYGLFYFILYFCTVEIVPVAFALKLIAERISQ